MAELKTKETGASVTEFLNTIEDEQKRKDCFEVAKIMTHLASAEGKMWGPAIVGFGNCRIKYPNGREIDFLAIGFSPRKANITIYLKGGVEHYTELLSKLGKHKAEGGCLHFKKLADVDVAVLRAIITESLRLVSEA